MTPTAAIMLLIWIAVIAIIAYVVEWFAQKAAGGPLPPPIRIAIWGIAALAVVLVLLGAFNGYVALP